MTEQDWKNSRCTFCGELDSECKCPDQEEESEPYDGDLYSAGYIPPQELWSYSTVLDS